MLTDRSPSGTHPDDATLLFLGDVVSRADADALIDELANDSEIANDPVFGATAMATACAHLLTCDSCSVRRVTLLNRVDVLLTEMPESVDVRASAELSASAADARVAVAVGELVPSAGAVPSVFSSPNKRRRGRIVAGTRPGATTGGINGAGGVLAGDRKSVV